MTEPPSSAKRVMLIVFFLLALLISWMIWVPQALAVLGLMPSFISLSSLLMIVPVWGPGLAAILVARWAEGKGATRRLFSGLRIWRVGIGWYLFAVFFPAVVWLVGRGADTLLEMAYQKSPIESFGLQAAFMLSFAIVFAFPSTLGEELGWRAFALPRLQSRYGALLASVILGLMWGVWHFPTWVVQGYTPDGFVLALVGFIPLAVLYTWLYNGTGGSLLLVWLFHIAQTITQYFLPYLPTYTDDVLVWLAAILVVAFSKPALQARQGETRS